MTTPEVSLLGLGRMGTPIAARLLTSLGSLTVWNRTAARSEPLLRAGATVAATPSGAAAPITVTVLTDMTDVEAMVHAPKGLIEGWRSAAIDRPVLVVCGTVSPVRIVALSDRLHDLGVQVVDAPLSGGVAGAVSGNLSVMVGGSSDAVGRAWQVLSLIGTTVRHLGPTGTGQTAKACNQVVVAATVTAISEALVLADAAGIDRTKLLELLAGGLAGSEVLRQKQDRWLQHDFDGGGSSHNQLKDLRFIVETATARDLRLPISTALREVFQQAVDDGDGDLDHAAIELSLRRHAATPTSGETRC